MVLIENLSNLFCRDLYLNEAYHRFFFSLVSQWMKLLTLTFHALFLISISLTLCLYKMQALRIWWAPFFFTDLYAKKNKEMNRNGNVKGVMKGKKKRLLVSVNVLGSVGPIRFLANEDDEVSSVINTALKAYARQGRIPVLGFNINNFIFYSNNAGFNSILLTNSFLHSLLVPLEWHEIVLVWISVQHLSR